MNASVRSAGSESTMAMPSRQLSSHTESKHEYSWSGDGSMELEEDIPVKVNSLLSMGSSFGAPSTPRRQRPPERSPLTLGAGSMSLQPAGLRSARQAHARRRRASLGEVHRPAFHRHRSAIQDEVWVINGTSRHQADITQSNLKNLTENMQQSMLESFPQNVWEECGMRHPDTEETEAAEDGSREARSEVRKKSTPKKRCCADPDLLEAKNIPTSVGVNGDLSLLQRHQGLMELASKAGVTVLDVEEVFEIYHEHVPQGVLDLQEHRFVTLLGALYRNPAPIEIRRVLMQVAKARRKRGASPGRRRREICSGLEEERLPDVFTFQDFFVGFFKWLKQQDATNNDRRCTLTRHTLTLLERFKHDLMSGDNQESSNLIDEVAKVAAAGRAILGTDSLQAERLLEIGMNVTEWKNKAKHARRLTASSSSDFEGCDVASLGTLVEEEEENEEDERVPAGGSLCQPTAARRRSADDQGGDAPRQLRQQESRRASRATDDGDGGDDGVGSDGPMSDMSSQHLDSEAASDAAHSETEDAEHVRALERQLSEEAKAVETTRSSGGAEEALETVYRLGGGMGVVKAGNKAAIMAPCMQHQHATSRY